MGDHATTGDVGIVACAAVAERFRELAPTAPLRAISPAMHESPLDPGDRSAAAEAVQTAVDALAGEGVERIIVAYARSDGALETVRAPTPLVVWEVDDCVAALRYPSESAYGDGKAPATYYLTPGGIDHGVDAYKLFVAGLGELEGLVQWFDSATGGETAITWPSLERLSTVDSSGSRSALTESFQNLLAYYDRVVLLDDGSLREHHHQYADRFVRFFEELCHEDVSLEVEPASTTLFERMVAVDPAEGPDPDGGIVCVEPETPIGRIR